MSQGDGSLSTTALQLRQAFDRSFAVAGHREHGEVEDVLAVRIAAQGYALRARDVSGLFKDRTVTPVPSPTPELLGLAGLRGSVVPVYDLRLLLGHPRGEQPRWLVLAAGPEVLGLAFDGFEGQFRVAREDVAGAGPDVARTNAGQALRPIVDVLALVEAIKGRVRRQTPAKER